MFVVKNRNTGRVIAHGSDSEESVTVLEGCWYFSPENVDMKQLVVTERTYNCPYKGVCYWLDLDAPDAKAQNVGFIYRYPKPGYENIKGRIGFYARETTGTISETIEEAGAVD